jgi:hypothetical protein
MVSANTNLSFGIYDLEVPKFVRDLKNPHEQKKVEHVTIHNGQAWSAGHDCTLKAWPLL